MDEFLEKGTFVDEKSKKDESEKQKKKEIKKTSGYMAWGLVLYTIIGYIIGIVGIVLYIIVKNLMIILETPNWRNLTNEEISGMFSEVVGEEMLGWLSCVMVLVGIVFLFIYFRRRIDRKQLFTSHKKMELKTFIQIFCVFMGVQLITEPIFGAMEAVFNYFGYSVLTSIEDASMVSTTIFMAFYAVILGPIVEELIYRGFVLVTLKNYGKILAIFVSAFLFGIMHGNIPQAVFAIFVGVVLGYVTIEYSIWWAILLHIINNGLSDIMYYLMKGFNEGVQNGIFYGVNGSFLLLGIYFVWKNRREIHSYWIENKPKKKWLLYALTSFGMIVFIVIVTLEALSMIEKV